MVLPTTPKSFQLTSVFPTSNGSFQLKTFQLDDFSNYTFQRKPFLTYGIAASKCKLVLTKNESLIHFETT